MSDRTRKPNGRSSIYLGKDGRWHGRVSMGVKANGQPDRRHVTGKTEAIVTKKVTKLEKERDAGGGAHAGRAPTVEEWFKHYLYEIAEPNLRATTFASYRSKIEYRIIPGLGAHRLDRLLPEHIEKFYADLRRDGLKPATIRQFHSILSKGLKTAEQRGRIGRNPADLVTAPSVPYQEVEPLTPGEARAILNAAEGTRNEARWSVALALGLRQGEALGLTWKNVNLDVGTVRISQALQRGKSGRLEFDQPKSRAGRRTVPLPGPLLDALRTHRAVQLKERMRAGEEWQDHDLVFAQENGKPIGAKSDWKAWKKLLAAAGVRDARLHDARHTAATIMLTMGVPPRVTMEILGHSQIKLTMDTYSHVLPGVADEAIGRVGTALWGPGSGAAEG